jgi:hypothetical protein
VKGGILTLKTLYLRVIPNLPGYLRKQVIEGKTTPKIEETARGVRFTMSVAGKNLSIFLPWSSVVAVVEEAE